MKFGRILSTLALSVCAIPASYAVDGYKNLKFGDSERKVLESGICAFQKTPSGMPGVDYFSCTDMQFGGHKVEAGAFFIGGKFLRLVIEPNIDTVQGLMQSLSQKYGPVSSSSSQESFTAVDTRPNTEAFLAFDNDTVYLNIYSDENNLQGAVLIYTSPQYDVNLLKMQSGSVEGDI